MLTKDRIVKIHTWVYKKNGYPTLEDGARAYMRGRRWAVKHPGNKRPPKGIADKLGLVAQVNKEIQITMIKEKEDAKNAEIKRNQDSAAKPVIKVSEGAEK